jgi:hemerythrin-like metal-binding protein
MPLDGFLQRFVRRRKELPAGPCSDVSLAEPPAPDRANTIRWQCGVAQLDAQNKALFQAIRRYQAALKSGAGSVATEEALAFLEGHADGHLALEEDYMERIAFPGLAEHRQGHRTFQHQIHAFRGRVADRDPSVGLELSQLLYAWMKEHILKEDSAWCEFAKSSRQR